MAIAAMPIVDIWEHSVPLVINENDKIDGTLGSFIRPFFVPNGRSGNGRFYPLDFWEHVLLQNELRTRISRRQLCGTVGHVDMDLDELIRAGLLTHFIESLWIDEKQNPVMGMGKAHVLDTPSGRVLYTISKARISLGISSKAQGQFLSETTDEGLQVPDKDAYFLERFDLVANPGFTETVGHLFESLNEEAVRILSENKDDKKPIVGGVDMVVAKDDKKVNMEEAVLQNITREKIELQTQLSEELAENRAQKKTIEEISSQVAKLKKAVDEANDESTTKMTKLCEAFDATPEDISEKIIEMKETLAKYRELGEPKEIDEKLKQATDFFTTCGSQEQIKEALEQSIDTFEGLGSPEQIKEALTFASEAFEELGSPAEIGEALQTGSAIVQDMREERNKEASTEIATVTGVDEEQVSLLLDKFNGDREAVEEHLEKVTKSTRAYHNYTPGDEDGEGKESIMEASTTKRLMQQMTVGKKNG